MSGQPPKDPLETAADTESETDRSSEGWKKGLKRLVREIQDGKAGDESFRRLFVHYLPTIVHFLTNRGLSRQDAEDLAQEVMVRVYKNIGSFRFEASFDTWLFRIVTNAWKNKLRSRDTLEGRTPKVPVERIVARGDAEGNGPTAEPPDPKDSPQNGILAQERTRLLHEALEELPPKMRQCVLLRLGQGLKYREVAKVMGVSMSTVKTQLINAYERLKPLLEEHPEVFRP